MHIEHLNIRNFRNIEYIDFYPTKGLNIFFGANGSGKTSLLEAIYLLGRGYSFRSSQIASVVRSNSESLRVVARIQQTIHSHRVGVEFNSAGFQARISGHTVKKRSQLAAQLPLLYISSYSHIMLDGGPRYRRQWLDWVLFHVEPRFHNLWRCYQRVLKQRNHALRSHHISDEYRGMDIWDKQLATYGEQITALREAILIGLQDSTSQSFRALVGQNEPITMEFKRGWVRATALRDVLRENLDRDRMVGYTRYGPHRAEVVFCVGGKDVREVLSRGQQKVFCYSLALGQIGVLCKSKEQDCIFLIDDFTSELDTDHQERMLMLLSKLSTQVFVTTVKNLNELTAYSNANQFHVELGRLEKMV